MLSATKLICAFQLSSIYWVLTMYLVLQSPLSVYPWIEFMFPWKLNAICKHGDFLCTHWNSRDTYWCVDMVCASAYILHFLLYAYVYMRVWVWAMVHVWRTQDNLQGSVLSFHHVRQAYWHISLPTRSSLLAPEYLLWLNFVLGAGDTGQSNI